MSRNYERTSFKKLLEKLQEESWQLELIISGFAIFGLFYAYDPVALSMRKAFVNEEMIWGIFFGIVSFFISILIFNLLLHVILRGLWIGALGLRYVSGEIDYEKLKYSPKFTDYLKKKVGSFDSYIGKLENYCSVIFAISFLLIFYVLAFFIIVLLIAVISIYLIGSESTILSDVIGKPVMIFLLIGMLLSFIDFITQGGLKRKRWLSKIYFPFYWVFGFITLSFLYKPLVYNFLDNKFGKRISFLLIPVYVLILVTSSLYYQKSNYLYNISKDDMLNGFVTKENNYMNLIDNEKNFITDAAIQSKVITDNYLEIYIPFSSAVEDKIFEFNPGLKPEKDRRGYKTGLIRIDINKDDKKSLDSLRIEYLKTFHEIYSIKIDTATYKPDFAVTKKNFNELGFETYIGIGNLAQGKHILKIERLVKKDSSGIESVSKIPFWYFIPN